MFSFGIRSGAVIGGAVLAAAAFALPASAEQSPATATHSLASASTHATVTPQTATGCNPDTLYPVQQCTQLIGDGLIINSITGIAINWSDYSISEVHIEIYGPKGTIKNCAQFNLAAYATAPICTWKNPNQNANMPPGDYCSRTWAYNGSGYTEIGVECVGVGVPS
jgi:hypothetical protein